MMRPRGGAGGDASQAPGPTLYSLMIVNKSGGLIYNKVKNRFFPSLPDGFDRIDAISLKPLDLRGKKKKQEFVPTEASLDLNDTLRAASIWHSLHAISAQVSPVGSGSSSAAGGGGSEKGSAGAAASAPSVAPAGGGAVLLRASTFDLHCFQTLTGTKFLATVSPGAPDVRELLSNT